MEFIQHIQQIPSLNARHWGFVINGAVRHPLLLDAADIRAFPSINIPAALICAHQPDKYAPDDPLAYNATWTGVPLSTLLSEIEIDSTVIGATLYAADGYTCNLSLTHLQNALLVYKMNEQPLTPEHGYPARIVVPGLYGYKMPKWIERIELSALPHIGFWEARGFEGEGIAQAAAWITMPQKNQVFAVGQPINIMWSWFVREGSLPIPRPKLYVNGVWIDYATYGRQRPNQLTNQTAIWTPPVPGDYALTVRILDRDSTTIVVHVR